MTLVESEVYHSWYTKWTIKFEQKRKDTKKKIQIQKQSNNIDKLKLENKYIIFFSFIMFLKNTIETE